MSTLVDLNNFSDGTFTFIDNRPSDVLFSYPTARDINKTITQQSFTAERLIDIIDVIKPAEANCRFSIDVSAIPGATVSWSVVPSGCSVSIYNQVYTIDGIDSKDIWDQVKDPTITVPSTFFGSFFYENTISYSKDGTLTTRKWQVGLYIPESEMAAVSTMVCNGSKVFGSESLLFAMEFTFTPSILDLLLVASSSIDAKFTVGYVSPAATLTSLSTISEIGEVTPQPLAPYLTLANPQRDDTDGVDHFATDLAYDGTKVLIGARAENNYVEPVPPASPNPLSNSGVAYLYDTSLNEVLSVFDPSPEANALFGTAVAITSSYLVVGAPHEDVDSDTDGVVHVFNKNGTHIRTINPTTSGNEYFGYEVETYDYDNDIVVVSAPGTNTVHFVDCDAGTLGSSVTQTDLVDNANPQNMLDANDGWFIAGAPRQNKAYVYQGTTLRHTLTQTTTPSNLFDAGFGSSVAISDSYVAVASYADDTEGQVWVYNKSTGVLIGNIPSPNIGDPVTSSTNGEFGRYMKMTDDYLFISTEDSVKANVNGRVWIYDPSTATQITGKKIYPPDALADEATPPSYYPRFGSVFAFDGVDKIVVGDSRTETGTKIYWYDIG